MEEALEDLLARLSSHAADAHNTHDRPVKIVEEVRMVLEHLADDELPAASAIFLAKVRARPRRCFIPSSREMSHSPLPDA